MNTTDLPGEVMSLQLKGKAMLCNRYMPFLEHDDLFVPAGDIFPLGDEVPLAVETIDHPKKFLRAQVAWINPARISAHRPKGVGLTLDTNEICIQTKQLVKAELDNVLHSGRATFTL